MSRVLVVDDDRATRLLIRSMLASGGHDVTVARDGREALAVLRYRRFDLMLLDVWMPRMSGLDLLERLRTRRARPRVIVMTSDDAPETVLKAVRQHAIKYLHKPVNAATLLDTVRRVLAAPEVRPIDVVSARPDWVELVVPCTREAAERIADVMAHLDANLAPDVRESVAHAFRELLLNAIEWGGRLDPGRTVRIACLRAQRMILYRIADPGPGFDITQLPHAAVGNSDPLGHLPIREARGMRPGGFGLLSVQATVDELLYNEQRNEVVFVKYLDPPRT